MQNLLWPVAIALASLAALGWLAYAVVKRYPKIVTFIQGLGNPSDPTTEVKLWAFAMGVVAAIGWLTFALVKAKGVIAPEWNSAFVTFGLLIGLGATIEALRNRKDS